MAEEIKIITLGGEDDPFFEGTLLGWKCEPNVRVVNKEEKPMIQNVQKKKSGKGKGGNE